ncbi:MAG: HD domain-containing protein, partial [Flavisolibacter sp.]
MTESQDQILTTVRQYVTDIYAHKVKPEQVFHNMDHTEDVAEASSMMADHFKLDDNDRFILLLSAWFHDIGYSKGPAMGHEEESIKMATDFLLKKNVDEDVIQRMSSAVRSTKMPQSPVSLVEKILCDADLFHLATEDFKAKHQLLKQEQEFFHEHKISKKEWRKNNIEFLENHKYFTEYGQQVLEPKKRENLQALKKKKGDKKNDDEPEEDFPYIYETSPYEPAKSEKNLKEQQKNTERGIQTMFRTTSSNHLELSSLADGKGNIMISVNSIILSVSLTVLLARIAFYPQYIIPTIMLLAVCLTSIIFAILATR